MWEKETKESLHEHIFKALDKNIDYRKHNILGLPASYLDTRVFPLESSLLHDAPYLSTLVQNPNHIGVHTTGDSESFFAGTQAIERELIRMCSEDIFRAQANSVDGYVATGGTEANLQAVWIYRNYFMQEFEAQLHEIALICSSDTHYSSAKAANVFQIGFFPLAVNEKTRKIDPKNFEQKLTEMRSNGIKYIIVFANMMTTMFGSVDDIQLYMRILGDLGFQYKIHVDGAYGGFYYPFVNEHALDFSNDQVCSITVDAHKMNQAPYGTGIFLIRKGWLKYTTTSSASYVQGNDSTLCGSRSGANAVAVYMILKSYGYLEWQQKMQDLCARADWFELELKRREIDYFREVNANIIVFPASSMAESITEKFGLVPDDHHKPNWFKIVIMDHVSVENLQEFLKHL